jgi:hypothetical protein
MFPLCDGRSGTGASFLLALLLSMGGHLSAFAVPFAGVRWFLVATSAFMVLLMVIWTLRKFGVSVRIFHKCRGLSAVLKRDLCCSFLEHSHLVTFM